MKYNCENFVLFALSGVLLCGCRNDGCHDGVDADIVIYGSTPAAISAARLFS
jgi:hypothetical protein